MNKLLSRILTVLALSLWVNSEAAEVLNFAGLNGVSVEPVLGYYNGGFGGNGSGPGPNYGITFSSNALACSTLSFDCSNVGEIPGGTGANGLIYNTVEGIIMNVSGGFNTGFSFDYTEPEIPPNALTVTVWSGLNGTGTLLATVGLPLTTGTGDPGCAGANYCPFEPVYVNFSGTAESVNFGGSTQSAQFVVFGDITLGAALPGNSVPEPVPLSMLGIGLAAIALHRRRNTVRPVPVAGASK